MIIVGGDFGEGSAYISSDNSLVIEGSNNAEYLSEQFCAMSDSVVKKKLGLRAFIVGAITLSILFALFFGFLGIVIGCIVAIPCSYISDQTNIVSIQFKDNRSVEVECDTQDVEDLKQLAKLTPGENKSDT